MKAAIRSRPVWRTACAAVLALTLAGSPALAQEPGAEEDTQPSPEELAAEGLDTLMRALELMLLQIPQYEMPEFNERGDIIIRRKNPPQASPEETPPQEAPESPGEETPDGSATET